MIVGVTGRAGSGKDTVADMILEHVPGVKLALADPLKEICASVFGWSRQTLWGDSRLRNLPDQRFPREGKEGPEFLTPRYALQKLGTEWGRDCYEDIWVDLTLTRCRAHLDAGTRLCVVSDVRFPNECAAIQRVGGVVWRVERPQPPRPRALREFFASLGRKRPSDWRRHASEAFIDQLVVNDCLPNGGSLADLDGTVRRLLAAYHWFHPPSIASL